MSALENKEDDAAWDRMEAELSRLRELVKEMREALADAAAEVESLSGQDNSCDPLADTSEYRAAIAKADAILGESGHE